MRLASSRAAIAALALGVLALSGCKRDEPAPAPSASEAAPPPIATGPSVEDWIRANYAELAGDSPLLYAKAEADLDGDGKDEILAYVGGPMLCGTGGCNLVVLRREGDALAKVGDVSVVQLPVGVLDSKTNGWRDLAVTVAGGGIPAATMRLPFDGTAYAENATVTPAVPTETIGTELIAQAPLKPVP